MKQTCPIDLTRWSWSMLKASIVPVSMEILTFAALYAGTLITIFGVKWSEDVDRTRLQDGGPDKLYSTLRWILFGCGLVVNSAPTRLVPHTINLIPSGYRTAFSKMARSQLMHVPRQRLTRI